MNDIYINIINSNIDIYKKDNYIIKVNEIIGRGLHGLVLSINNYVIKIYQKYNIEIEFYNNIINNNISNNVNISNLTNNCAIGYLVKPFVYNNYVFNKKSNIIIMPIYKKLNDISINIKNEDFLLNFIKKIFKLLIYIEKNYNFINLDVKLQNIMYDIKKDEIILLDYSLIIKNNKNKFYIPIKKYKQLPNTPCNLSKIPIYSIYICVVDILFENNKNLYNYNINKIISLLFYQKYSYFFINLLERMKNLYEMKYVIRDIEEYNKKTNNKWFAKLLIDYYLL